MPGMKQSIVAAATIALAGQSYAQSSTIAKRCPIASSGICYMLNIPETTASSGAGDIFFSITAPTTFEWVGLGQGKQMKGANIFVVYQSADGQNVTVSPRLGVGNVEPDYSATAAQLEVLEGSGISNGTMTANVRCSNCNSWAGGTMDFTSSSASWIHAELAGTPIMSDDLSEDISMHSEYGIFNWDFTSAKGGNDANPFIATDAAVTDSSAGASDEDDATPAYEDMVLLAHGIMGCVAFGFIFPIGGIIIRVAKFTGVVWIHAATQILGWAMFIAVFGMGLWMAIVNGQTSEYHPIVGYVIFALLVFQPVGGLLHHAMFKKHGTRTVWSFGHIWVGRIAIILGIINGGLGLLLAGPYTTGQYAAYGVLAGFFGAVYLATAVYGEMKRSRNPSAVSQKDSLSSGEHKA